MEEGRAHVAPDGGAVDPAEVGLLDPGTIDTAPPSGRVVLRLAAFAAVAAGALVGLGLAMPRISPTVGGQPPKGTILTQDFRLLHHDNFIRYDPKESMEANIEAAFDHFVSSSGFARELSDDEVATYRANFIGMMQLMTKDHGRGAHVEQKQWRSWLKTAAEDEKPMATDAFVDHVNRKNLGFSLAKRPGMAGITKRDITMLCGKLKPEGGEGPPTNSSRRLKARAASVPAAFATFDQWPDCREVIRRVHYQGSCGSCWAFAALSVLDSRLCIKTQGRARGHFKGARAQLSRSVVTSCAGENGCAGGMEYLAFEFVGTHGVPTGGDQGCIPYFGTGDVIDHWDQSMGAPPCTEQCKRTSYPRSFHNDKFTFGGRGTWYYGSSSGPLVTSTIRLVQQAMMIDGPVAAGVCASGSEWLSYESGILRAGGCRGQGFNHAVAAIGYGGDTCGGEPARCSSFYWRLLNSWGASWGDNGEVSVAPCEVIDFTIPDEITSRSIDAFPSPMFPGDSNEGCTTTDGTACVFPFTYAGVTYETCTSVGHDVPWCSTHTDSAGNHVSGNWGGCSADCQAPTPSPTPAPTPGGDSTPEPTPTYERSRHTFVPWRQCGHTGHENNCGGPSTTKSQCVQTGTDACDALNDCVAFAVRIDPTFTTYILYTDGACVSSKKYKDLHWDLYEKVEEEPPSAKGKAKGGKGKANKATTSANSSNLTNFTNSTPPVVTSPFKVVAGTCQIEGDCAVSPNFPGAYRNNDACTIEVTEEQGMKVSVVVFNTEHKSDYLYVNGLGYSGNGSQAVGAIERDPVFGTITWSSDASIQGQGWKICHGVEPTVELACDTVFDDLQLAEGERRCVTLPDGCASYDQAVWGSNPYTSDSNVCEAAAHFGKDGRAIQVKALGRKNNFEGSKRNGIRTSAWSSEWDAVSISQCHS